MGTITKAPIGVEDLKFKTSGTTRQTFTRNDSNGRTLTLNQLDAEDIQLRGSSLSVEAAISANSDAITVKVDNVAALRLESVVNTESIFLKSHTALGDGGHGPFRSMTGAAPGTYVDNNGTIIIPTDDHFYCIRV